MPNGEQTPDTKPLPPTSAPHLPEQQTLPFPSDKWYEEIYQLLPKTAMIFDQAKQLIKDVLQPGMEQLRNILYHRPFGEKREKVPVTVDLIELQKLKARLEEKTRRVGKLLLQSQEDPTKPIGNYLEAAQLGCEMFQRVLDSKSFTVGLGRLAWARDEQEREFSSCKVLVGNCKGLLKKNETC